MNGRTKIYFSTKLAYNNIDENKILDNTYIKTLPLMSWLEQTVGKMSQRKDPGNLFSGDGWLIGVDYYPSHSGKLIEVKPYVLFTEEIASEKITEFIMLWS